MREVHDRRLDWWSGSALRDADVKVGVEGLAHIDTSQRYLVMSNHQSSYDIFVLMQHFPGSLRMVAKAEMFKLPIFGRAMETAEFIRIDRSNTERAIESLELAKARIESGINVWIAPEGTRSEDGRLLPFKKGGFMLALDSGVSILPVTVRGTDGVLPAKQRKVTRGKEVSVRFHPPVDPLQFGHERRDDLIAHVRSVIDSGLPAHLQST